MWSIRAEYRRDLEGPGQTALVNVTAGPQARGRGRRLGGVAPGVLVVISAGGVLGALARHGLDVAFPHGPSGFPWATFAINVTGCALIGALMAAIDRLGAHRLVRAFLGVGVLGGFTTFATHIVHAQQALAAGAAAVALVYLAATLIVAVAATWAGSAVTSTAIRLLARTGPAVRRR